MYTINSRTLQEFSRFMGVDLATICKLEQGRLDFIPYYHEKLKVAIKRLHISNIELASMRKIIEMKGYK
ncbi:XRE family transcriptional regulator [Bacillus mycoides]|uniref:XRE family transcriptional regulator n=1 Tax=Bacillus mycoides TaxID=1405 RepID=UPI003D660829